MKFYIVFHKYIPVVKLQKKNDSVVYNVITVKLD